MCVWVCGCVGVSVWVWVCLIYTVGMSFSYVCSFVMFQLHNINQSLTHRSSHFTLPPQIEDIFIVGLCRERSPCGVVVCHRNKIALRTLDGACVDVVASSGLYSSVYFSNNQNTLLGRVDIREEDGHLAWGSGVKSHEAIKIYDYTRGLIKHTISCKQRHVVTALNFGDSPPNMVVTGNTDYKYVYVYTALACCVIL